MGLQTEKEAIESDIILACAIYAKYEFCNLVDYSVFSLPARLLFLHLFYLDNELNIYDYDEDQIKALEVWEEHVEIGWSESTREWTSKQIAEQAEGVEQAKIYLQNKIDQLLNMI